jgi:hypothetical protein
MGTFDALDVAQKAAKGLQKNLDDEKMNDTKDLLDD